MVPGCLMHATIKVQIIWALLTKKIQGIYGVADKEGVMWPGKLLWLKTFIKGNKILGNHYRQPASHDSQPDVSVFSFDLKILSSLTQFNKSMPIIFYIYQQILGRLCDWVSGWQFSVLLVLLYGVTVFGRDIDFSQQFIIFRGQLSTLSLLHLSLWLQGHRGLV